MRGLLKKLLRPPFNEVVELTHVKIYIADDTLVLTGANLSQVINTLDSLCCECAMTVL